MRSEAAEASDERPAPADSLSIRSCLDRQRAFEPAATTLVAQKRTTEEILESWKPKLPRRNDPVFDGVANESLQRSRMPPVRTLSMIRKT
ncbi:hypothetical protein BDW68DRAFT_167237 [Aspergillus falconensis]